MGSTTPAAYVVLGCVLCLNFLNFMAVHAEAQATLYPANGATNVCPDAPLRIIYNSPLLRGSGGKVQIFDAANDSPVAAIDIATQVATRAIGGLPDFNYYTTFFSGNQVTLTFERPLAYGKTYYVKFDSGAFTDTAGKPLPGVSDSNGWRFTTKPAWQDKKVNRLTVAADGSGDFDTVQGALDFIPEGNTAPITIFIKSGTYNEIVCVGEKHAITLLGEDRAKTIITYPNNNGFNSNSGGNPFGSTVPAPATAPFARGGAIYRRGLLLAHRCRDLTISNLTLYNSTRQGGSQAEAIILNGSPTDAHATITNVNLYSYQDTLQINGQAYLKECYIEGDVDFLWGTGPCFFDNCYIRALRSGGYYTQIRNPPTNHGYVFKSCTLDGSPGVNNVWLSRIAPARFTHSELVLIDCLLSDAVHPIAWQLQQQSNDAPNVHFWEYNSHGWDGKPVDTSKRKEMSRQLKLPDDKQTIDNYSDPKFVLGGWAPK